MINNEEDHMITLLVVKQYIKTFISTGLNLFNDD